MLVPMLWLYRLIFEESKDSTIPPLAFNSINRPLKEYEESLLRILTQVDEIESHDSDNIKKQRKELAVALQIELDRVDGIKNAHWEEQQSKSKQVEQEEAVKENEAVENKESEPTTTEATSGIAVVDSTPRAGTEAVASGAIQEEAEKQKPATEEVAATADDTQASEEAKKDAQEAKSTAQNITEASSESEDPPRTSVNIEITSSTEANPTSTTTVENSATKQAEVTARTPTYAEIAKAKLAKEEAEARAEAALNDKNVDPKDEKDENIVFEVESVSSEASDEYRSRANSVGNQEKSVKENKFSEKSTTVSDEEDEEEDVKSEGSFEMIH